MEKILYFIHEFVKWIFTIIVLILIDLPLKLISCIIILICGIIWSVIYPLIKNINTPIWIAYIYAYATKRDVLISKLIYNLWKL